MKALKSIHSRQNMHWWSAKDKVMKTITALKSACDCEIPGQLDTSCNYYNFPFILITWSATVIICT
jgi:hypothetical protein